MFDKIPLHLICKRTSYVYFNGFLEKQRNPSFNPIPSTLACAFYHGAVCCVQNLTLGSIQRYLAEKVLDEDRLQKINLIAFSAFIAALSVFSEAVSQGFFIVISLQV